MAFKQTELYFLETDCSEKFGAEKGARIFELAKEIYRSLCEKSDFKGSKAIEKHMKTNLFPTMAYYKALRKSGYAEGEAIELVKQETAKSAEVKKAEQQKFAKMPCTYFLYRLFVKSVMKKKFPAEGWTTEWVRCDGRETHFNFTRCLYKDVCDEQGCPELCPVFCANDDIAFTGLMPKIRFEREQTLGKGGSCCDFHFIKNK